MVAPCHLGECSGLQDLQSHLIRKIYKMWCFKNTGPTATCSPEETPRLYIGFSGNIEGTYWDFIGRVEKKMEVTTWVQGLGLMGLRWKVWLDKRCAVHSPKRLHVAM